MRVTDLPGGDLIAAGLDDLRQGHETIAALLVAMGGPRLRRLGLPVSDDIPDPEMRLYHLLAQTDGDSAHTRYNALVRQLVDFERAAERAQTALGARRFVFSTFASLRNHDAAE